MAAHERKLGSDAVRERNRVSVQALRAAAIVMAAAAIACAASVFAAAPPAGRVLALSANPAATSADPLSGITLATRVGVHGTFVSYTWSSLEQASGGYTLDDLRGGLVYLGGTLRLKLLLGIQVLNTTAKETPGSLQGAAFDSPAMMLRFRRLLAAIRPYLNRNVEYLSIGNEVDVYLAAHPAEWDAYTRFYRFAVTQAHALAPWIKVGVTTTFDAATREARLVDRLNRTSDVEILTYYPLGDHFAVRAPTSPLADFPTMLRLSGRRPLVLQEVGYPSAQRLHSSPTRQATFVRAVYRAWGRAGSRVPFLNFFLLHDFTRPMCEQLGTYYGARDENFLAYLCSLGLRQTDGRQKPAWTAFIDGAARVRSRGR